MRVPWYCKTCESAGDLEIETVRPDDFEDALHDALKIAHEEASHGRCSSTRFAISMPVKMQGVGVVHGWAQ